MLLSGIIYQRRVFRNGIVFKNFPKIAATRVPKYFFYKVAGLRPAALLKKGFWHSCFPVNFAKFLRVPF